MVWLPKQAKQELVEMFQLIEREVAWPWQVTVALVTLTRKPSASPHGYGFNIPNLQLGRARSPGGGNATRSRRPKMQSVFHGCPCSPGVATQHAVVTPK